ncbi:hypothetical protein EV363DRAFT_1346212, partial [Boletus edulis]
MPFGDSLDKREANAGTGRLYYPQVNHVACGANGDSYPYPIVAVSNWAYDSGNHCNQGIIVMNTANKNVAYARIRDKYLSEGLFAQLGGTGPDMEINWYYVEW